MNVPDIYAKLRERISILDFIPLDEHQDIFDGVSTFDCYKSLCAAIDFATTGSGMYVSGAAVYFPNGKYNSSETIHLKKRVRLYGDGSGLPDGDQAVIVFASGKSGFIVHRYNTCEHGVQESPTTAADGTIIEGLSLHGSGNNPDAHGIWLRARASIRAMQINGFGGNGINVVADAVAGGLAHGNANNFEIDVARITNCGKNGLYVHGGDTNAGVVKAIDATANGGFGIYDSSFLGNTYLACHAADNKAGAYKSDGLNARNLFIGCYSEGGQPPSSIAAPAMVIGGSHGAAVNGPQIDCDVQTGITMRSLSLKSGDGNASLGIGQGATKEEFLNFTSDGWSTWRMKSAKGRAYIDWANLGNSECLAFYNRSLCNPENGYNRDLGSFWASPIGLPLGYFGAGMLARVEGAAAPTEGKWLRGDVMWNTAPVAGGNAGWMCVESGEPGVWRPFGAIYE